jgi:hypothetical protein
LSTIESGLYIYIENQPEFEQLLITANVRGLWVLPAKLKRSLETVHQFARYLAVQSSTIVPLNRKSYVNATKAAGQKSAANSRSIMQAD